VADGIKENTKSVARLEFGFRGANAKSVRFGRIEVLDEKIEVQLLRYRPLWPRRRNVRGDLLKTKHRPTLVQEFDPRDVLFKKVAEWLDFESGQG
jgi:hypothetical protein